MRIAANSAIYPQYIVDNDEILSLVRQNTPALRLVPGHPVLAEVLEFLSTTGAKRRHWLAANEKPIDLIQQAFGVAMERAQLDRADLSNLIYCGVDRPILEPSSAALIANELELPKVRAFDVVHACLGWFTALQIAGDRADYHGETTVIIGAEFPMTYGGVARPINFDLTAPERRRWKYASFVLGEAAAATIVVPGGHLLAYKQVNDNTGFRASMVSLPQPERFLRSDQPPIAAPDFTFYANAEELTKHGTSLGFTAFDSLQGTADQPCTIIPHTISSRVVLLLRRRYKRRHAIVDLFPEYGNLGSVSMAAGFHEYRKSPSDYAGGKPIGWMLAAGMSAVAFDFPL
jgi:3-oxoacyl-[acyl-carrier-protein] synthase III